MDLLQPAVNIRKIPQNAAFLFKSKVRLFAIRPADLANAISKSAGEQSMHGFTIGFCKIHDLGLLT
jgi:hypothetical protein